MPAAMDRIDSKRAQIRDGLTALEGQRLVGIMTNTDLHILLQILLQTECLTGAEQSAAATAR